MKTGNTIKFGIATYSRACFLSIALCLMPPLGLAEVLSGLVVGVSDGDTIKVLDDSRQHHTIRLLGIDAPEKAQAFGQQSKQSLSELVLGQSVLVEWFKRDRYGRTIGKLFTQEGHDLCLEQITRGMAWHYKKYAVEQSASDRDEYAAAERVTQESRVGLWQDETPMPPWVWRHSKAR